MAKQFLELRERLLCAGVAPRHVRRYLTELEEHWADLACEEERSGKSLKDAEAAAFTRLGNIDRLAQAMIARREFHSWYARAPWAMFTLMPLLILGAAYLIACCYLWLGWRVFLPGADTPFINNSGSIYSLSNIYFQAGKYFYLWAPILVGWLIAFISARQRLRAMWLALALLLIAWMGGTAQIHAGRSAVHGFGHISMNFFVMHGPVQEKIYGFLLIFCVSVLPYFLWRVRRAVA